MKGAAGISILIALGCGWALAEAVDVRHRAAADVASPCGRGPLLARAPGVDQPRLGVIGSSPHARGTHFSTINEHAALRFIPACAGNAITSPTRSA